MANDLIATATETARGGAEYLSPELIQDPRCCDPRSDIFSAGVVLWELVAKTRLFVRDTDEETLRAHLADQLLRYKAPRSFEGMQVGSIDRNHWLLSSTFPLFLGEAIKTPMCTLMRTSPPPFGESGKHDAHI